MSRNPCKIYVPSAEEEAELLARLPSGPPIAINTSRCDGCNKIMEESEFSIRGYASGQELGLCRRCASHVNSPEAIEYAEKLGHKVHSRPIYAAISGPQQTFGGGEDE